MDMTGKVRQLCIQFYRLNDTTYMYGVLRTCMSTAQFAILWIYVSYQSDEKEHYPKLGIPLTLLPYTI